MLGFVAALGLGGCASTPQTRSQHVVDGEVVSSRPVSPREYENYLRVRLALESEGADLARARFELEPLLRRHPDDAHLWTTSAELEHRAGDPEAAQLALSRALKLQFDYAPALALREAMQSGTLKSKGRGDATLEPRL